MKYPGLIVLAALALTAVQARAKETKIFPTSEMHRPVTETYAVDLRCAGQGGETAYSLGYSNGQSAKPAFDFVRINGQAVPAAGLKSMNDIIAGSGRLSVRVLGCIGGGFEIYATTTYFRGEGNGGYPYRAQGVFITHDGDVVTDAVRSFDQPEQ